ncbi:hypothetical protein [uncultured Flavobacterium sp.]|uniref:hypothetical protein n=1 Tax=uncultured Flavobacterium sp. TaxID=165435 RepID=UPI0030EC027F|tara:strand:+ start:1766 stop:2299 length:534 start_codon:yes stop_codon:yes gene_type:complete
MKHILKLLFITVFVLFSCSNKEKRKTEKNANVRERIKVIKLGEGRTIIFPAEYAKKILTHPNKVTGVFTPDVETIKYIEENLPSNFDSILAPFQKNSSLRLFKKDLAKYDKQFLGYTNSKKDSLIVGYIVNLESDPYKIKPRLEKEFCLCLDGWCYTNTCEFIFNKKTKRFGNSNSE